MALHKDSQGNIHDDMDGAALHLLPEGCTEITDAEHGFYHTGRDGWKNFVKG